MYFYGSLRVGQYNYNRFKDYFIDNIKYNKTERLKGFELYGSKKYPYPFVVKTNKDLDTIEVDVMNCSEECYNVIKQMELSANYTEIKQNNGFIYVVDYKDLPEGAYKIADGNWLMEIKRLKKEGELV